MTAEQVMDVLKRDIVYYRNSGGGVTFSGGEPTMQPQFLSICLQHCKQQGIHTAVDTCGFVKWSILENMLPFIDLFLYDIKHMDDEKHKTLTGTGNRLILENLQNIIRSEKPVWIRVPLIPGYNDSLDNLLRIRDLVEKLSFVEKVSILPYNSAAGAKYQFIGKKYSLEDIKPPPHERMEELLKVFSSLDTRVEFNR